MQAEQHSKIASTSLKPNIVVVGSINMDLVIQCARLPTPGETILGRAALEMCGGKGANQAVAAARAGGHVTMVGRVGDDAFAERLIGNLNQASINTAHVAKIAHCSSGVAVVAVEDSGQNSILVVPGANAKLTCQDLVAYTAILQSADIVLLQMEVPIKCVVEAIRIARVMNRKVILNPAPAPDRWPGEFSAGSPAGDLTVMNGISLICPNETEAAKLTGLPVESLEQAEKAGRALQAQGIPAVCITLAARGVLLLDGTASKWLPAHQVAVVDTTAAGDAFAGALAVRWAETDNLLESVRFANAAAALAVTRPGAQQSIAYRTEIDQLLSKNGKDL